jgi:hypothetical protein
VQLPQTLRRLSLAQDLYQHGGVEQQYGSAHPAGISLSLGANPARRVLIPLMALVVNRPDGGKDLVPAALVIERAAQDPRDEGASPALSNSAVQFGHQLILEAYV